MGKPQSPHSYRDDPDAVSMHTTPGDTYQDDLPAFTEDDTQSSSGALLPPTYDDATTVSSESVIRSSWGPHDAREGDFRTKGIASNPEEVHMSYTSKAIWRKRTRIGGEVLEAQDPQADFDAKHLQAWIEYMADQAPHPYIHITGTHKETTRDNKNKSKTETVTDFRILISLRNYLWPGFNPHSTNDMELRTVDNGEKTFRGTISKQRAPGAKGDIEVGELKPELTEWCHRYCAAGGNKIFRLTRAVKGLDQEHLQSRLEGLIRSTNYKGHLSIEFPIADRAVDIYSTSALNNWRLKPWLCWIFYLTFLWIFSWPVLYFSTKKYHVVKAEWPFSQADAHGTKTYTTVSEEQWIEKFGLAVRQLCLDRYQGRAGDDLLTQVLARPETTRQETTDFRNTQRVAKAAVSALQGGFNARSQVSNVLRFASSSNDQVGWGFDT